MVSILFNIGRAVPANTEGKPDIRIASFHLQAHAREFFVRHPGRLAVVRCSAAVRRHAYQGKFAKHQSAYFLVVVPYIPTIFVLIEYDAKQGLRKLADGLILLAHDCPAGRDCFSRAYPVDTHNHFILGHAALRLSVGFVSETVSSHGRGNRETATSVSPYRDSGHTARTPTLSFVHAH